jgi:hypothetical protein
MKPFRAPTVVAVSLMALTGCAEPKATFEKVRVGMTEAQVVGLLGSPTSVFQQGGTKVLEYETFDQDRWFGPGRKENIQVTVVRLVAGRVEAFGKKGTLAATKAPEGAVLAEAKAGLDLPPEVPDRKPVVAAPFDLRNELEKLEKLKKDGLITEPEFKELRQRVLDKAKAQ